MKYSQEKGNYRAKPPEHLHTVPEDVEIIVFPHVCTAIYLC